MKINKTSHRPKRKIIVIVICILTIITISYFTYAKFTTSNNINNSNQKTVNMNNPTDEQKKAGVITKESTSNATTGKTSTNSSDQPLKPVTQSNGKSTINISMTSPLNNTAYKQDDTIYLRFLIESKESTGSCKLTLSKNGSTSIEKTASPFQSGPTTSTCKGFDIPASSLSAGTWNIDLVFENDTIYGHTTGIIIIN